MTNTTSETNAEVVGVLEAASDLEAQGRPLEAIQLLTEANRNKSDRRIEEHLVVLRHAAFESLGHRVSGSEPPRITATDAPSGELAELPAADVDAESLRTGLAAHGCVLVRELVPRARAEELVAGIDRALAAFDAAMEGAPVEETSPWYVPFVPRPGNYRVGGRRKWMRASGGVWTVDSPRMLFDVIELIDELGILSLVTDHLGERPALSANKCNLRRVPIDSDTNWHQDGAFLGAEARTLNFWLALSECGIDAPGLDIVPRRIDDILETGTEGAIFDWSVSPEVLEKHSLPVIRPELDIGDAIFFDHLLLHRTAVEPSMTKERHAIETWMFAPSRYPAGQIPVVL